MDSKPSHSGDMSHDSERGPAHRTRVPADAPKLEPAIDPAARASKRMYQGLSSSSVGLELGLAVVLGLLFGMWLDRRLGTEPWMMLVFLGLGLVAGFRNLLRAVARAERDDHA
jgi:ATP synthase protein I